MRKAGICITVTAILACGIAMTVYGDRDIWAYVLVGDGAAREIPLVGDAYGDSQRSTHLRTAERMAEALEAGWGVPNNHIETHHAWAMTVEEYEATLKAFAAKDDQDGEDVFIFYYVGHGESGAMRPYFAGGSYPGYDTLRVNGLNRNYGTWVIILECCYSGSAASEDELSEAAWILASVGDTAEVGWYIQGIPTVLPFTDVLATAMESNAAGVIDTFDRAMQEAHDSGILGVSWANAQPSQPNLHIPPGQEADDPLREPMNSSEILMAECRPEDSLSVSLVDAHAVGELPGAVFTSHVALGEPLAAITLSGITAELPCELTTIATVRPDFLSESTFMLYAEGDLGALGFVEVRVLSQGTVRFQSDRGYPFSYATDVELPLTGSIRWQGNLFALENGELHVDSAVCGTTDWVDYWVTVSLTAEATIGEHDGS